MKKITPFLWFDDQAEEALRFYVSVFKDSKILEVTPGPGGKAFTVRADIGGQELIGLNAGPQFKFTEAISLFVDCKDQAEVDDLWAKLSANGGEEGSCGWVKDRFGPVVADRPAGARGAHERSGPSEGEARERRDAEDEEDRRRRTQARARRVICRAARGRVYHPLTGSSSFRRRWAKRRGWGACGYSLPTTTRWSVRA